MAKSAAHKALSVRLPPVVMSASGGPPLPRVPAALARRFQQVCASMVAEAIAGEPVVQLEYGSLIAIEIEPGIDQRRLAEAMGIDTSNASLIVERLHAMGLIKRQVSAADRRARQLFLTPKGKTLWRRVRLKSSVASQRVLAPLAPDERELFLDFLVRVIEGNRPHARPGGGRRKRGSLQSLSAKK
jgi:DNA-binding MarR family transcriptional regulator